MPQNIAWTEARYPEDKHFEKDLDLCTNFVKFMLGNECYFGGRREVGVTSAFSCAARKSFGRFPDYLRSPHGLDPESDTRILTWLKEQVKP